MQCLLFLRLAAVPAEGLIVFLMQDAVQLSAALQGVLWQMCETPLESMFLTCTLPLKSNAHVFARQHPPLMLQNGDDGCAVRSPGLGLPPGGLTPAPAAVKLWHL